MEPMRIYFITGEDVFYVIRLFRRFLALWDGSDIEIAGTAICNRFKKKSFLGPIRYGLDFYGPRSFVSQGIRYLYRRATGRTIEKLFDKRGIPVKKPDTVNDERFLDYLRTQAPDLVISVSAPQVFRKPLIDLPRLGCINIHSAILPAYRGLMPVFWAMYHGEREIGLSVHYIDERIDHGPLIRQVRVPVPAGASLDEMLKKMKDLGGDLLWDVVQSFRNRTVSTIPYPDVKSSYYSFPRPEDVREFRRRGYRIL